MEETSSDNMELGAYMLAPAIGHSRADQGRASLERIGSKNVSRVGNLAPYTAPRTDSNTPEPVSDHMLSLYRILLLTVWRICLMVHRHAVQNTEV